jgi:hypothetical protein
MGLKKVYGEEADWIHLADDTDQWRALVNRIMDFLEWLSEC